MTREGPSFRDSGVASVGPVAEVQNYLEIYSRRKGEHDISHVSKLKTFKDQAS